MLQQYHTKLKGTLALTDSYQTEKTLQKEKGLYKFIWVRKGSITVEIDHQEMLMSQDDVISLTHLQHLEFKSIDGEYTTLLFNSNFYCIYGNDHEVSCSGFLFNGSSHLVRFTLNEQERRQLNDITVAMENEFTVSDSLQEEMLRILLKRFIIQCTRIARHRLDITREKESGFEIVRQYYNLVDDKICNFITYWFTVTYNVYQRAVLNLVSFWYHYITFVIISLNFISYIFLLYF